jgi:hypothetical protein
MHHVDGKIVVKVNHEYKRSHRFDDGTVLKLERGWNNLNQREVSEVNCTVISGEGIPSGAEALIHHNATHETYRITNHGELSGQKIADRIEYYSIPEDQLFFWRKDSEVWNPIKGYATGLRVFKPYKGILHGIEPTKIKDTLFITSGALKGQICHTLRGCDYEIIFQDLNGRENRVIRFRHSDDDTDYDREELTCISGYLTKELNKGNLLIGLTPTDAKPLKELAHV